MNKDLKNSVFQLPKHILYDITIKVNNLNGKDVPGSQRARKLLRDKSVKYGQLKRIIHDLQTFDKVKHKQKYDLAGGDVMLNWGKQFLKGERDLISNRKDSKKRADVIGGLTGERKNTHLKKHKKRFNFKIPVNLIKSNSHKTSVSPITSLGIFEEIDKFKKLIKY